MHSPLQLLVILLHVYSALIFVWVLGSWFPQWRYQDWFRMIDRVVAPYVNLFRGLNLQVGMLDLSAMAAMLVVMLVQRLLLAIAGGGYVW